jgi:hypothetical protein
LGSYGDFENANVENSHSLTLGKSKNFTKKYSIKIEKNCSRVWSPGNRKNYQTVPEI